MAVGNIITATEFNRVTGQICKDIEQLALAVEDTNAVLHGKTAEDWALALDMSLDDVSTGLTAMFELEELINIYQGEIALANAKDFRTFIRRVRGLSSII